MTRKMAVPIIVLLVCSDPDRLQFEHHFAYFQHTGSHNHGSGHPGGDLSGGDYTSG